jgi:hypothetical protein
MGALVIYESMYGNTRRVAEAVAAGLGEHMHVDVVEVSRAAMTIQPDLELLVVGGPTHIHGMTTARTRSSAAERATGQLVSSGIGLREWLEQVAPVPGSSSAAAFDTRIDGPKVLTGSAAGSYTKHLRRLGFAIISDPQSFLITTKAPQGDALGEGELGSARAWGRALGAAIPVPA